MTSLYSDLASALRPGGSERERLGRALALLPLGAKIDGELVERLAYNVRGGLGDEAWLASADPDAHVEFWRVLADRFPSVARLRGLLADTLFVTGHADKAREAFLVTFRADPRLVYAFAGDVRDLFDDGSERERALYRAVTIRAAELDDPSGNAEEVRELTNEFIAGLRDRPDLLREALTILTSTPGDERP